MSLAMSVLSLSLLFVGCAREVRSEKTTTIRGNGTVRTKESTVKESPDGTVTREEKYKRTP